MPRLKNCHSNLLLKRISSVRQVMIAYTFLSNKHPLVSLLNYQQCYLEVICSTANVKMCKSFWHVQITTNNKIDFLLQESNYWCDADGLVIIITAILFLGLFYFLVSVEANTKYRLMHWSLREVVLADWGRLTLGNYAACVFL